MSSTPLRLIVTGDPGCGKTTLVRRMVDRLRGTVPMTGFVTEEVREAGQRTGFRGVTLDGESFRLATRGGEGDLRLGPYVVELEGLESVGLPALVPRPDTRLVVLDEIGKMELLSPRFRTAVDKLLASDVALLATAPVRGVGFVKRVRNDPRVVVLRLRRDRRDTAFGEALRLLRDAGIVESRRRSAGRAPGGATR